MTAGETDYRLLIRNAKELAPFVAFGYHMAAVRGEIPPVLSRKRVRKWLESRPWVQERCARVDAEHTGQYEMWFKNLVAEVMRSLERTAVVRNETR